MLQSGSKLPNGSKEEEKESRFSAAHALMAYNSAWNTVVYLPRLKLSYA
jgi:hypothetical protein